MAAAARVFPADVRVGEKVFGLREGIGEDLMAVAYLRLKDEGRLPVFFHCNPAISLTEWMKWHTDPNLIYLGCFEWTGPTLDNPVMLGAGFINTTRKQGTDTAVEVSEFFFKGTSLTATFRFGKLLMEYCFRTLGAKAIHGVTPVENRAAVLYSQKLGFHQAGPIPAMIGWGGGLTSAVISYLTREEWEASEIAA